MAGFRDYVNFNVVNLGIKRHNVKLLEAGFHFRGRCQLCITELLQYSTWIFLFGDEKVAKLLILFQTIFLVKKSCLGIHWKELSVVGAGLPADQFISPCSLALFKYGKSLKFVI